MFLYFFEVNTRYKKQHQNFFEFKNGKTVRRLPLGNLKKILDDYPYVYIGGWLDLVFTSKNLKKL
jgi:hypothetical protein